MYTLSKSSRKFCVPTTSNKAEKVSAKHLLRTVSLPVPSRQSQVG